MESDPSDAGKVRRPEVQHWRKPEPGWIKVNSDAAFRAADSSGATACIIRNELGQFKVAQARWYDRAMDVCMMEALGLVYTSLCSMESGE
jgi:hypothetical protein